MQNQIQIVFGIRAIIEALNAEKPINKVYLQKDLQGELFKELEYTIRKKGVSCSYVPIEKLNKLSKDNHQGAVAQISPIAFQDFEETVETIIQEIPNPLFLLLDQVTDVRNFGAIIRTAECSGVNAIIIPKSGSAPLNENAIKTSAGAAFKLPISKVNHLKDAIFYLQSSGINIVAASEKADNLVFDIDFTKPTAIIMGAEDKGISPSILKIVDEVVKLPMLGDIESLNVSVACGIFLYETVRQRLD